MAPDLRLAAAVVIAAAISACSADAQETPAASDFLEVEASLLVAAPEPQIDGVDEATAAAARHGQYLVTLLGCAACHTDGALIGEPVGNRQLAGSSIGIAVDNPLDVPFPSVVFASNLTPDDATGLGNWKAEDIARAIRHGADKHGRRLTPVMPWPGYALLSDDDAAAIVTYLQQLEPVRHNVPKRVPRGRLTRDEFVYFGIYQRD